MWHLKAKPYSTQTKKLFGKKNSHPIEPLNAVFTLQAVKGTRSYINKKCSKKKSPRTRVNECSKGLTLVFLSPSLLPRFHSLCTTVSRDVGWGEGGEGALQCIMEETGLFSMNIKHRTNQPDQPSGPWAPRGPPSDIQDG